MKIGILAVAVVGALIGAGLVADLVVGAPLRGSHDALDLRKLDGYVRITDRPFPMHDSTVALCRAPGGIAVNPHEPAHPQTAFCHVYVNDIAKDCMLTGKGIYPEGSIVIKSKLAKVDSHQAELFTVMQKMASGYDTDRGNWKCSVVWKYSVVDGTSYREVASGRIDSCIECHEHYKGTDYITRAYMAKEERNKR